MSRARAASVDPAEPDEPAEPAQPRVELLWFQDCVNHPGARALLDEVLGELAPGTLVHEIDATHPAVAQRHRFPGSPTIRIDGRDIDPSYQDPGDYTPRCRLYRTADGLRGLPERAWIEAALQASLRSVGAVPRSRARGAGLAVRLRGRAPAWTAAVAAGRGDDGGVGRDPLDSLRLEGPDLDQAIARKCRKAAAPLLVLAAGFRAAREVAIRVEREP